ncbi:MAG TPA: BMP family ABC transporter substrate-binding protein [Rubrobacteraceae bacterium]|nr:BMP family ABC transporter substrate-binding protein [Rubrobacteraceae bacterium]
MFGVCISVLALALVLAGCGGSGGGGNSGGGSANSNVKPGLVLDVGGLGDQGFNDSAYAGMKRADKDLGVKGKYLESSAPTDYANNLTQLAENQADPIIAVGFLMTDDVTEISKQFPDTQFAIVDSVVDTKNTISLVFREQEGSYLAGVVAGLMTQEKTPYTNPDDKVVGFVGGQEGPLIGKFQAGYEAGVKSVCSDCKVLVQYAGSTPDAFNDPAKGKEISQQQIEQGADVIYHAAGNTGRGLFEAAGEEKIFAIGVDLDQAKLFKDAPILTSVIKRVDVAVEDTIKGVAKGGKPKGEIVDRGLKEKGLSLAPFGRFDKYVPQKVKDDVAKAKKGIIDGKIKVPDKVQ